MPTEIERDRWGRPLILPVGGGAPVPYVRVSTMAKSIDDLNNLMAWKQRKTAQGLLIRPDLITRLAGALANGDPDTDYGTKRELDAVCREATEAAGASSGASTGTGLHSLTEAIDRGDEPLFVPESDRPRLDAYRIATAPYKPLDAEVFVVNDALGVAGSFDRTWLCPDGRVRVGDLKTGKSEPDYPLPTAIQLAMYSHGNRYDPETGARSPIDPRLDVSTGLLIHLPASGGCRVIPLNLDKGWQAARTAAQAYAARKWTPADLVRAS
jgi:hypothetical protein